MRALTLALLVLGILTDDAAYALAFAVAPNHEAAVFADRRAGRANFHGTGVVGGAAGSGVAGVAVGDAGVVADGAVMGLSAVAPAGAEVGPVADPGEKR